MTGTPAGGKGQSRIPPAYSIFLASTMTESGACVSQSILQGPSGASSTICRARQQWKRRLPPTIRQLAAEIGVPPILVVLAFVNGRKRGLDEPLTEDAEIYLMGPVAGG